MALQTKVGSVALNTSTGNQAVTGVGFTGKAILFFLTNHTADGTVASIRSCYGMATSSTARAAIVSQDLNAANPTDSDRYHTNAKCLVIINNAETVLFDADFVSFDADGFTINVTTTDAVARILNYVILGGSDMTNAKVLQFTSATSTGNQGVTGVGFKPDAIIPMTNISSTAPPVGQAGGFFAMGFGQSSTARAVTAYNLGNGTSTSIEEKTQLTNKVIHQTNAGATFFSADLVSLDTDGFTLNWTTANGTARYIYALCLKGGNYKVGSFNQPTATGDQALTGFGFTPSGIILASFNNVTSSSLVSDVGDSFGFASGASAMGAVWMGSLNGVTGAVSNQDLDRTAVIKMFTNSATPTVNASATVKSFDSDGATLTWGAADSTAREVIYIAVGSTVVNATSMQNSLTLLGMGI